MGTFIKKTIEIIISIGLSSQWDLGRNMQRCPLLVIWISRRDFWSQKSSCLLRMQAIQQLSLSNGQTGTPRFFAKHGKSTLLENLLQSLRLTIFGDHFLGSSTGTKLVKLLSQIFRYSNTWQTPSVLVHYYSIFSLSKVAIGVVVGPYVYNIWTTA